MRVFIVSCVFPPEPVTSALTSADLADEMARRGHEVIVFAPFPNRPTGNVMDGYVRRWKQVEYKNDFKIVHSWHTLSKKSHFIPRVMENISFGLTSTWQLLMEKSPHVVYMNTWPVFSQNFNSWLLRRLGIPIVCSVQDIYPESLTGKGMLKKDGWISRVIRYADLRHLQRCTKVTSISSPMLDLLIKNRQLPKEKIYLVPNWMDASKFLIGLQREGHFRQLHGINSGLFLAVFAGSLTMSAGVGLYLKVAEMLSHRKDIRILLVGDGSMREKLERDIVVSKVKNIQVVSPLREQDVPEVQAAGDILLLSLSGEMSQSAAPSKLIAYMLSGRPTVASISSESATAKILSEAEAGFVLPPDDPRAVAELLIQLADNRSSLDQLGKNARKYAETHFSKQVVLPIIAGMLESVANRRD